MAEASKPSPPALPADGAKTASRKGPKPKRKPEFRVPADDSQGPPLLAVPRKSFSTSSLPRVRQAVGAAGGGRPPPPRKESQKPASVDYSRVLIFGLILSNALWGLLLKGVERKDAAESSVAFSDLLDTSELRAVANGSPRPQQTSAPMHQKEALDALRSEEYERVGVKVRRLLPGRGLGLQGFVFFSAYRTGPSSFAAMGLAALAFHTLKRSEECRWERPDGTLVAGEAQIHYPGESHRLEYETILFLCNVTGAAEGAPGGTLLIRIDGTESAVYSEPPGTAAFVEAPAFRSNITHCSAPIYGAVHAGRIREWMLFHERMHGVDRFVMYDAGGVDAAVREAFQPWAAAGRLEVVDIRGTTKYETWLFSQVLVVNDCAYRVRGAARWALFMDFDEYLMIPAPPPAARGGGGASGSLSSLKLLDYVGARPELPWITFGSVFFSCKHCLLRRKAGELSDDRWAVEKLVYGEPWVHCKNTTRFRNPDMCLKYEGHRKYIVQPNLVNVLQIHRVMNPAKGGVNTPAKEGRINHYRGLAGLGKTICRYNWTRGQRPTDLTDLPLVGDMAASARAMDPLSPVLVPSSR